jgi:ATP/maltotriose-dependent transcriptional regulator MalT
MVDGVRRGRQAFEERSWAVAHDMLARTGAGQPLDAEDLERLAVAAYFVGHDDECEHAWERAHQVWMRLGDVDRAARCAFWLGLGLAIRGENARSGGWFARANRVIADAGTEVAACGYLLVPDAMECLAMGNTETCDALYQQVTELGERFGDPDLVAMGRLGQGEAAIAAGDTRSGLALLDEVMVAATTGEVSPLMTGILYCAVIEACMHAFDLRRAAEWTDALGNWCDEEDIVPFRGQCLVHRSQVLQAHGEWATALTEAMNAQGLLARSDHIAVGAACCQQGDLHRLRGEHDDAERAYAEASRHGHETVPGLALLRLEQGSVDAAAAAIRRMIEEPQPPAQRVAVLAAFVDIMLATGDADAARGAHDELTRLADATGAPLVVARAHHAGAAILLAENDPSAALTELRRASSRWRELGMPYEWTCTQELIGLACRALGDVDAGDFELHAALAAFERLGAATDAARVAARLTASPRPRPGSTTLTERECEVLRLVAAGRTNREIGSALSISEHTAARHIQNIFTKLGVSSRAAATARAYEHGIV